MDNIEYMSAFYVSPYIMNTIKEFESTKLYEILNKISNENQKKQIERNIL